MAIQPATGELWCVVNERDELGDNVPFDYVTEVKEGGFYGWPWYYIGGNQDPRQKGEARPTSKDKVTVPDVLFQAHSAPLSIAFYDGDQFPRRVPRRRLRRPARLVEPRRSGPATRSCGCCSRTASRPASTRTS